MTPRYGPPDASLAPRSTGIRTFARFPHVPHDLGDVERFAREHRSLSGVR